VWNLVLAAEEGGEVAEVVTEVATTGGWFLENAWLVPVVPAVCWALILLLGKQPGIRRLTNGGAYIGVLGVLASLVLSLGVAYQWIQRVGDAEGEHSEGALGLVGAIGKSIIPRAEEAHGSVVTPVVKAFTWFEIGSFEITWGSAVDGLVMAMLVMVCIISLMVHIFSLEYVRGDERFTHYFSALSLFTAGMLNLVVAQSTLQLLLGWEIMGLCSFLLIGHWWEEKKNSNAAMKAFFTTRTGDIGLLVGLSILFWLVGGFGIAETNLYALSDAVDGTVLFWAALALLVAIIGKSGQFPLHTWLPDAMAGPTPVSALIHAATMVVAGVYLGARIYPVFYQGFNIDDGAVNPMAVIGAITIVIAALLAFVQHDIKKVLAYSTVSQLGFMVMALGVGGWIAAVFHIFTHAFFKALLFLGAGSVSHSGSHHSFDMREMGGLRKYMPVTFVTFLIGTAALMGIFPLSGFWSKDEIIATAGNNGYTMFLVVGLVGAFLTAAYMTRCVYLVFFGEYRGPAHGEAHDVEVPDAIVHAQEEHELEVAMAHAGHGHGHHDAHAPAHGGGHGGGHDDHGAHEGPHESPALLTVPLVILSVLAITAGWLQMPWEVIQVEKFLEWVEPTFAFPSLDHPEFSFALAGISVGLALVGVLVTGYLVSHDFAALKGFTQRNKVARAGYLFLVNKYYLDDLYEGVIVRGIKGPIAAAMNWVNQNVIDAVVNGAGTTSKAAGRFAYRYVDQDVIDGVANGAGTVSEGAGEALRPTQSGKVSQYGAFLFGFAAILTLAIVISVT
jgi:NADH-quinone oxidoreductase subunit L